MGPVGPPPTQLEVMLWPQTLAALEALAPVVELLGAD
jgi:hypothetical protein